MPVIVDMFPGTGKYRGQLREAWDTLLGMRPVPSKKEIKYKFIKAPMMMSSMSVPTTVTLTRHGRLSSEKTLAGKRVWILMTRRCLPTVW